MYRGCFVPHALHCAFIRPILTAETNDLVAASAPLPGADGQPGFRLMWWE